MAHDDERVQLEDHGDPPSIPARERAAAVRAAARGPPRHADAPRDERGERRESDEEADDSVSELDERVVLAPAGTVSPQRGQFSQPSPEPVSRTVAPVTSRRRRGDERRVRNPPERLGESARAGVRVPPGGGDVVHQASTTTPLPASTRPIRARKRSWAAKVASSTALLGGERDEQPARRLRVEPDERERVGRPSSETAPATNSRFLASPPVRTPRAARRARRRAPGGSALEHEADTAPPGDLVAWPKRPAGHVGNRARLERPDASAAHGSARSSSPRRGVDVAEHPVLAPARTSPVPSGFVRKSASPAWAVALAPEGVGGTRPDHGQAVLRLVDPGSCARLRGARPPPDLAGGTVEDRPHVATSAAPPGTPRPRARGAARPHGEDVLSASSPRSRRRGGDRRASAGRSRS